MPRIWIIAAAVLALASTASAQTPGKYVRLYDALWSTVNENFYDPHFRGADWAGARQRYRARAEAVRTDAEFSALATAMLGEMRSSHLHVTAPSSNAGGTGIAVRLTTIGADTIVSEVAPLSDARRQGLRPGDRLLSPREAIGGAIGTNAEVRVQNCDGRQRTLSIARMQAFWPPEHPGFRWSQVRTGENTRIGYMRIDRFDDGAAALADQAMSELRETQALIIDLRGNSGGNVSSMRLSSYFLGGPEAGVILLARPYLQRLGHPVTVADLARVPRVSGVYTTEGVFTAVGQHGGGAAFWTEAAPYRYTRPVFVLIGPDTGSAAEGFAWHMRLRTHARLIGQTTAGELLSSEGFDIGDGWSVTIPVHGLWGADGQDFGDRAVPPHEEIAAPTRDDLCAGRDRVLDAALRQANAAR